MIAYTIACYLYCFIDGRADNEKKGRNRCKRGARATATSHGLRWVPYWKVSLCRQVGMGREKGILSWEQFAGIASHESLAACCGGRSMDCEQWAATIDGTMNALFLLLILVLTLETIWYVIQISVYTVLCADPTWIIIIWCCWSVLTRPVQLDTETLDNLMRLFQKYRQYLYDWFLCNQSFPGSLSLSLPLSLSCVLFCFPALHRFAGKGALKSGLFEAWGSADFCLVCFLRLRFLSSPFVVRAFLHCSLLATSFL